MEVNVHFACMQEIEEPAELDMSALCVDEDDMQKTIRNSTGKDSLHSPMLAFKDLVPEFSSLRHLLPRFLVVLVDNASNTANTRVRYAVTEFPVTLPFQKAPVDKPNPKQGVGKVFMET